MASELLDALAAGVGWNTYADAPESEQTNLRLIAKQFVQVGPTLYVLVGSVAGCHCVSHFRSTGEHVEACPGFRAGDNRD